ncbi:unnamed protein product [Blepharisma stoltei]|uniref:Uncharacterized protein n=1 Tax=Blepharisma stoltei TaxID=1481888 RepID=A0AAU9KBL8_9CILI|nr:unnamed protein product [Blepharisma stoltei]
MVKNCKAISTKKLLAINYELRTNFRVQQVLNRISNWNPFTQQVSNENLYLLLNNLSKKYHLTSFESYLLSLTFYSVETEAIDNFTDFLELAVFLIKSVISNKYIHYRRLIEETMKPFHIKMLQWIALHTKNSEIHIMDAWQEQDQFGELRINYSSVLRFEIELNGFLSTLFSELLNKLNDN